MCISIAKIFLQFLASQQKDVLSQRQKRRRSVKIITGYRKRLSGEIKVFRPDKVSYS